MDRIKPVLVRKLFQQRDKTWLVVSLEQFEPSRLQTKEKKMYFFPKHPLYKCQSSDNEVDR